MRKLAVALLIAVSVVLVPGSGGCGGADETPPVISEISASNITTSTATITWTTDEPATSQVEYGTTSSYGSSSVLDSSLATSHTVNLTGLTAGTTYHYKVKSADAVGNEAVSPDYAFATLQPVTGVSLNKASTTIAKGLSEQLVATILPPNATNQDVAWSSTGNSIAAVSASGLVTAVGVGTAVITVTTADQGLTASCTVTVTEAELVSLAISPAHSSVEIDGTLAFHATGTYTDNTTADLTAEVTWSSSDNAVASISNVEGSEGLLTGVTKGTVTISAQLGSIGSSTTLKVTYPYWLKIGVPYVATDGLTVTLNSVTIVEKTGSYQYIINYTLTNNTPDQAIDEGTWGLDNLNQYGFFRTLYPGDSWTRSYTFEDLKDNPHSVLFYPNDWSGWSSDSLKWKVEIP